MVQSDHLASESIPWRVTRLEETSDKHAEVISVLQQADATSAEQIVGLTKSTDALKGTMDRVLWALIGLCVTIAGSAYAIHPIG